MLYIAQAIIDGELLRERIVADSPRDAALNAAWKWTKGESEILDRIPLQGNATKAYRISSAMGSCRVVAIYHITEE